jgi:hypothetical protein
VVIQKADHHERRHLLKVKGVRVHMGLGVDLAVDLDLRKATLLGMIRPLDHAQQGRNASAASQDGMDRQPGRVRRI